VWKIVKNVYGVYDLYLENPNGFLFFARLCSPVFKLLQIALSCFEHFRLKSCTLLAGSQLRTLCFGLKQRTCVVAPKKNNLVVLESFSLFVHIFLKESCWSMLK